MTTTFSIQAAFWVRAPPCILVSAELVVALVAHVLRVMLALRVRTARHDTSCRVGAIYSDVFFALFVAIVAENVREVQARVGKCLQTLRSEKGEHRGEHRGLFVTAKILIFVHLIL